MFVTMWQQREGWLSCDLFVPLSLRPNIHRGVDTPVVDAHLALHNTVRTISRMPKGTWTFSGYSSVTRQGRPALYFYPLVESAWHYYIFLSEKARFVGFFFTLTQSSSPKGRTRPATSISVSGGSRGYYHLSSTNASQPSGREVGTKLAAKSLPTNDFWFPHSLLDSERLQRFPVGNTQPPKDSTTLLLIVVLLEHHSEYSLWEGEQRNCLSRHPCPDLENFIQISPARYQWLWWGPTLSPPSLNHCCIYKTTL